MGPWVGGSLGQLCGGVFECTGPTGRIQTCQLVVQTVKGAGSTRSGLSLMFTTVHQPGAVQKPVKVSI